VTHDRRRETPLVESVDGGGQRDGERGLGGDIDVQVEGAARPDDRAVGTQQVAAPALAEPLATEAISARRTMSLRTSSNKVRWLRRAIALTGSRSTVVDRR
jgi:hypothetical protein